jgi:hypothetical protein
MNIIQGKTLVCSKCKDAVYCGRNCQRIDWTLHKKTCGKAVAPNEMPTAPGITMIEVEDFGIAFVGGINLTESTKEFYRRKLKIVQHQAQSSGPTLIVFENGYNAVHLYNSVVELKSDSKKFAAYLNEQIHPNINTTRDKEHQELASTLD